MEEIATQPSTQPRVGTSISEEDEADVICILHPCSQAAYRAVELVARQCPQHILQNEGLEQELEYDEDDYPGVDTRPDTGSQDSQGNDDTQLPNKEAIVDHGSSAKDIALRISSKIHNLCAGFTFGRNSAKCDIPLATNEELMKLSNVHFRIYINHGGVLMAEDTSTNGTWVDKYELRATSQNPAIDCRRTLNQGSIISLPPNGPFQPIRFIVGIPARNKRIDEYTANLAAYQQDILNCEREAALAGHAGNMMPPPQVRISISSACFPADDGQIFNFGQHHNRATIASVPAKTFAASTTPFQHGMNWNGGDTYNVVAHIGKGAFANVYKLSTKANGDVVAAKEIEKRKYLKEGILDHKVHNEIEIMQKINHVRLPYSCWVRHILIFLA